MPRMTKPLVALAAITILTCASQSARAESIQGKSYSYVTLADKYHSYAQYTGCVKFDSGGVFRIDVNGSGYVGTWTEFTFRKKSFFKAHVNNAGIDYYVTGAFPRTGLVVGSVRWTGDGYIKFKGEISTCDPIAP